MKKFEEIIRPNNGVFLENDVLALMKLVREQTLKECAEKATAGMNFNYSGNVPYVKESSILGLSKDSIEYE